MAVPAGRAPETMAFPNRVDYCLYHRTFGARARNCANLLNGNRCAWSTSNGGNTNSGIGGYQGRGGYQNRGGGYQNRGVDPRQNRGVTGYTGRFQRGN